MRVLRVYVGYLLLRVYVGIYGVPAVFGRKVLPVV